jgi:hypothetical protein
MASYPPPNFIEPLPIFNTANWVIDTSAPTTANFDTRYLRFPVAQGTESFNDLISVGTANLTNISIADTTSITSSAISQSTAGILTIDNNELTSGSIVFKANDSVSAEQTILTLSGDSGTTTTLPIIANGGITAGALISANGGLSVASSFALTAGASLTLSDSTPTNSTITQIGGVLTLDNNLSTSGTIAFKANNGSSVEVSLLTLSSATQTANNATPLATAGLYTSQTLTINNAPISILDATGTSGQITQSSGRTYIYNRATPSTFTNPVSDVGTIIMRTMTTAGQFQDIAVFQQPGVSIYRSLTLQGTTPNNKLIFANGNGGSIQFADNSVQSSAYIPANAVIPFYQTTCFFRNLAYGRCANIYFNFSGPAWGLNEFFTVNFRYEVNSVLTASTSTIPTTDFTIVSGSVDIYPYRCVANTGTDTAYGLNQASTTPTQFPQFNNNIYNGTTYINVFSPPSNDAFFYPRGRYFWVSNYSITQQGTQYSQTAGLLPLQPYIPSGSGDQSRFGFALWNYNTTSTYTQYNNLYLELTNRGAHPITITGDYTVFADASIKTNGF